MLKMVSFFMVLSSGFLYGMHEDQCTTINELPLIIRSSGTYTLAPDVVDNQAGKKHKPFSSAIRVLKNATVVIDLNGNTLHANGRTFGIDGNGAKSLVVRNGTIKSATRAISSLNNDVSLFAVCTENCTYPIETTAVRTTLSDINAEIK
jgi:hypothetical protein